MILKHRPGIVCLVLCLALPAALAQGRLEDYQRAERFLPGNVKHHVSPAEVTPHWIEKTNRFWYRRESMTGAEFVLVDADHNTSDPAFDHARLAELLSRDAKQHYSASALPFSDIEFTDGGKALRFAVDDARWTCQLATYDCQKEVSGPEKPNETLSPDKRWAAYVKDHNLYLRDVSTGAAIELTHDGVPGWDYASPLPSLRLMVEQQTEEVKQPAAVFWSSDSSKLITYRIDSRNSGRFTSLQFVLPDQLRPRAFRYVYPLPGEVLAKAEPTVFDVRSGKRVDVKTAPIELPFQDGPGFDWFPDSKSFWYDSDERGYKQKELRIVDASTGDQNVLLRESSDALLDPGETFFRFVEATGEVFWSSERDGWNHLYLYSKTGQLENQVTQGPWVVRQIEHVDEKNRRIYFLANGREKNEDPYQAHLYSVGFDGKDLELLSPGNANHSVSISPDGTFFVDNYSRPDLSGEVALRRTKDGSEVRVLEKTDATALMNTGWKFPEPFQGKAADGTTALYGLIWRPSNFDPLKKYPIIEQVYTGPQGFFVPKTFSSTFRLQEMAELGFIVVMVDGRGTEGRSRCFHQFSYHNLGGAFEDHVAMIKQMAGRYPTWMRHGWEYTVLPRAHTARRMACWLSPSFIK